MHKQEGAERAGTFQPGAKRDFIKVYKWLKGRIASKEDGTRP